METVTAPDDTTIAYDRAGHGPPLVLVHGGSGTRHGWDALRPHFVDDFHLAETVIRENRAIESYRLADDPSIDVPTLLITGEHGPEHLRDATHRVHDVIEESRLVELEGVGHSAIASAPARLASEVRRFVRDGEP